MAVNPNGDRLIVAYDTTTVPQDPPTRYISFTSYHATDTDDNSGTDEIYVNIDGARYSPPPDIIWSTDAGETIQLGIITGPMERVFNKSYRVQMYDYEDIGADDLVFDFTFTPADYPEDGTFSKQQVFNDSDYTLNFYIRSEYPPPITVTPIVIFTRNVGTGLLSNPQRVTMPEG